MLNAQAQIQDTLSRFDFDRVHRAMTLLGWQWQIGDVIRIPTVPELETQARILLEMLGNSYSLVSSGGLVAERTNGELRLRFVIEES